MGYISMVAIKLTDKYKSKSDKTHEKNYAG